MTIQSVTPLESDIPPRAGVKPDGAPRRWRAPVSSPRRLLIVAATYALPYRVLRCAHQTGAEVHVIGNLGAQPLSLSRFCGTFTLSQTLVAGRADDDLAFEINALCQRLDIEMVLPGDAHGTRTLIACRERLEAPCFPLPDLETFDLLNDKWRFARLCETLGFRHPATCLVPEAGALTEVLAAHRFAGPVLAKPRGLSGGRGILKIRDEHDIEAISRVNYQPIVLQEYLTGRTLCASIYCHRGAVTAFMGYEFRKRVFSTFTNDRILADLRRFAAHAGAHGVYNFDILLSPGGALHYLECNPRFFYNMHFSMLAGTNFVALGLGGDQETLHAAAPAPGTFHLPEALLTNPRAWRHASRRDWLTARHALSDPLPYLFDLIGWPT